jgi:ketosteroid isomerase-like protein
MRIHLCSLVLMFLTLAFPISPTTANDASDQATLENAAQSWIQAFNAADVDALITLATADVILLDPNGAAPITGAAVRAALQRATAVNLSAGEVTAATKEAVLVGDVAWRIAALSRKSAQGAVTRSPSLEIWKRVDGRWKLHRISASILTPLGPRRIPDQPVFNSPTH